MPNYYEILNLSRDTTQEDIRSAYKQLALQYHPDKNPSNREEAEIKFKQIAEAYGILSDPMTKTIYDALLPRHQSSPSPSSSSPAFFKPIPPYVTALAKHTKLDVGYLAKLEKENPRGYGNIYNLQSYLKNFVLMSGTGEEVSHQILTLQEILSASENEMMNLLAASRFVQAGLMTISEGKQLTVEERNILFQINANDPNDLLTKMSELQEYRNIQTPKLSN